MTRPISLGEKLDVQRENTLWARYQAFRTVPAKPISTWEGHNSLFDTISFDGFSATYKEILGIGGLATWSKDAQPAATRAENHVAEHDSEINQSVSAIVTTEAAERSEDLEKALIQGLPRRTFELAYISRANRIAEAASARAATDVPTGGKLLDFRPRREKSGMPVSSDSENNTNASAS